jgi:hypothetical protein
MKTIDMGGYHINSTPTPDRESKPYDKRLWIAAGLIFAVLLLLGGSKTKATPEIPSKAISEPFIKENRPTPVESKPLLVEKTSKSVLAVGNAVNTEGNGNKVRIGNNVTINVNLTIAPVTTVVTGAIEVPATEIVEVEEAVQESDHCRKLREEHEKRLAKWKKMLGVK